MTDRKKKRDHQIKLDYVELIAKKVKSRKALTLIADKYYISESTARDILYKKKG